MMSQAARAVVPPEPPPPDRERDQFVVLYGIPWRTYSAMRELIDSPAVRMTYLQGALEIMSPSAAHEDFKKRIARLVELFALERDIPLYGYGSTTFRRELGEKGLEPDECYTLREPLREVPDIALEVVMKSGGIDKLEVYRGLGVREVWMWRDERIQVYALRPTGYEVCEQSELIPTLDFAELAELAQQPDQHAVLKEYRARLRTRA